MKKLSILALIAILLVTLCSCGGSNTSDNSRTCEVCHDKTKKTSKYTIVLGQTTEKGYMCKDCAAEKKQEIETIGGTVK